MIQLKPGVLSIRFAFCSEEVQFPDVQPAHGLAHPSFRYIDLRDGRSAASEEMLILLHHLILPQP